MKLPGVRIEDRAARSQLLVAGLFEDERPFLGLLSHLDWKLAGRLHRVVKLDPHSGNEGELRLFLGLRALHPLGLAVLGLGRKRPVDEAFIDQFAERVENLARRLGDPDLVVEFPAHSLPRSTIDHLLDRYGAWQLVARSTDGSFAPLARSRTSMKPREAGGASQ